MPSVKEVVFVFNACSLVNLGTMITSLHFVSLTYEFTRKRNHSNHKLTSLDSQKNLLNWLWVLLRWQGIMLIWMEFKMAAILCLGPPIWPPWRHVQTTSNVPFTRLNHRIWNDRITPYSSRRVCRFLNVAQYFQRKRLCGEVSSPCLRRLDSHIKRQSQGVSLVFFPRPSMHC